MNNFFDFKRFGSYLMADIKSVVCSCGLSVLLMSCSGLIINVAAILLHYVTHGSWEMPEYTLRQMVFLIFLLSLCIHMPVKCYGHVTDTTRGGFFTLVPVSSFEKSISMIIVSVVITLLLPVLLFCCLDVLVVHAFPSMGLNLLQHGVFIRSGWEILYMVSANLAFLLGATVFKKQKEAKTVIIILLAVCATGILSYMFIPAEQMAEVKCSGLCETSVLYRNIAVASKVMAVALPLLLCGGIFYRIRTITH